LIRNFGGKDQLHRSTPLQRQGCSIKVQEVFSMSYYFLHITRWVLAIGAVLLSVTILAARIQADPSDDLSFSFAQAPLTDVSRLMSVDRVTRVFNDHLVGVPARRHSRLARYLLRQCSDYQFDPAFVLSLIQVESRFRAEAVSPVGAVGLMQIMPATAGLIARRSGIQYSGPSSLRDPFINITLGMAYLSLLREKYQGLAPYFLVAAYNIGPAKLDELLSRKYFKPVKTKQYYQAIRHGVHNLRFYKGKQEV
jgi:soluble lytic murein transglycosylase-like protein